MVIEHGMAIMLQDIAAFFGIVLGIIALGRTILSSFGLKSRQRRIFVPLYISIFVCGFTYFIFEHAMYDGVSAAIISGKIAINVYFEPVPSDVLVNSLLLTIIISIIVAAVPLISNITTGKNLDTILDDAALSCIIMVGVAVVIKLVIHVYRYLFVDLRNNPPSSLIEIFIRVLSEIAHDAGSTILALFVTGVVGMGILLLASGFLKLVEKNDD